MHKFTVILAHRSDFFTNRLRDSILSTLDNVEIVDIVFTSDDLITSLLKHKPDILITDVLLQASDSLGALKTTRALGIRHRTIMVSRFISNSISYTAMDLDIDFFLLHPIDFSRITQYLARIIKYEDLDFKHVFKKKDYILIYSDSINILLRKLGFKFSNMGTKYLCDAILYAIMEPVLMESVTKILYPELAKKRDTKPQLIERSIRHALNSAYELHESSFVELLGYNSKPTNADFINRCIEHVVEHRKEY